MFYKLNVLNAKTSLRRIAPASSKSGRADALKERASTRVILYRQGRTTMFNLDQAIRERHSTRLFLPQPVPRELVNEALALAQYAPSNSNIQPWHMVFASGASRDRPDRRSPASAAKYSALARVVSAFRQRAGRSSLRCDGNLSRRHGETCSCSPAQLGIFPRASGRYCLHAPGPWPSGCPQCRDVPANVAVGLDRTRPR